MRGEMYFTPRPASYATRPEAGGLARLTVTTVDRCWLWTDTRREIVLHPSCGKIKTIQRPDFVGR